MLSGCMALDRERWDRWCERGILALVLGILLFGPLAMGAVDAIEFIVIQGLTMGVMGVWALRLWIHPRPRLLWPPISWVVLAFTLYAVGRYFTADIEYVARLEMIQVLMYAFLFFAVVNNLHRQEAAQLVSFSLIFLAAGISGFAIYQFLTHSNQVWNYVSPYAGRGTGTYISPNNLAGFLELVLPLALAYTLVGRIKPVTRILLGYAALVILAGLAVTFSRGGWVAVAAALLLLLGILAGQRQHRLPALLLLIVLLGGGAFFVTHYLSKSLSYIQRVDQTLHNGQLDFTVRHDLWGAAERMWLDHFWWGVGPAHYDYRFKEYRPESVQMRPERAHNDYLNLLADWGAVGGVMVLAGALTFGAGLFKTWKFVRRAKGDFSPGGGFSNRSAFFLGATAGLLALAVHSLVDFNLHMPANAILGVTWLALLSSNLRFATAHYWRTIRWPVKASATVALIAGVIYLAGQGWRRASEDVWLERAKSPELSAPETAATLEKAFAAEPMNFDTAYKIGEAHRIQSFQGGRDYPAEAQLAMQWYARGFGLNRWDSSSYLRYGMCLDWLDRADEAGPYFNRADALDPNSYFIAANIGWHYIQVQDYTAARAWLERSLRLHWQDNVIAANYLEIAERKLVENASSTGTLPSGF